MSDTPVIQFIPEKQGESELFSIISEMVEYQTENFAVALNDVASKYTDPSSVTVEVVTEIFRENGLSSVVNLLTGVNAVDYNTVLAFSAYITLLKGSRTGYETVLRLIGFEYTMLEWWEEGGTGTPNTFSIDINLNASKVESPYETFQKFKKFTSEYVFPVISPLGYTYVIELKSTQVSCHGAPVTIYDPNIVETSVLPEEVFGPSNWIATDVSGQHWVVKVNSDGLLKAFKAIRPPQVQFNFVSDNLNLYFMKVDTQGTISFEPTSISRKNKDYVRLMDGLKNNWYIYIKDGEVVVSPYYEVTEALTTENYNILLQENGSMLVL